MCKFQPFSVISPESPFYDRKNILDKNPPAILFPNPVFSALPARLDAFPNLSALENATPFVMPNIIATITKLSLFPPPPPTPISNPGPT